ncbi:hypothetical protein QP794_21155 [Paenibacillus sp. UMB7766-LJ446]|uniref:AAA family ATPase n=1 Tax=Paenibacillus sp. UMB7766-LJ446 TaxID=3046313 RepID=UPI00254CFAF3|nr:AAA family ATPase [Paenibacillus sp. UMB7766-LJ446]MDK8192599.1 hypothetical protein [Paenibacillus sp. UMB7766-LJ446]
MTTKGFFISRLRLINKNGLFSEIEFKKGLNVIVGPTNTGKSFIFECINFMFGGKDVPDPIEEVVTNDYDLILLELENTEGRNYTIERDIKGKSVKKYNCSIDEIHYGVEPEILSTRHSKNKESISNFLMSLSGYQNTDLFIKKNKLNKLNRFTYRNYNDFILIDEIDIISKQSPVHSDNNKTKTSEESAFRLILTGKDDSSLTEDKDLNRLDSTHLVQIGLLEKLVDDLELDIPRVPEETEINLEEKIKKLISKRSGISSEIEELSDSRITLWREIQQVNSKILSTTELLNRFYLLKKQYETDIDRIHFLIEGDHYFSLLSVERCPLCSQQTNKSELDCSHFEVEQRKESYKIELNKILIHLEDLKNTISTMNEELEILKKELYEKEASYQKLSRILDEQLAPQNYILEEELRSVLKMQKDINDLKQKHVILTRLLDEKEKIQNILGTDVEFDSDRKSTVPTLIDHNNNYEELSKCIKHYLAGWEYPGYEEISFDMKEKDILISGKPRRLFGKGYRSISYSAFILGLMRYCNIKGLPHPGIVVLDSPVTSYKEEDEAEDKTSEDLQTKFFEFISEDVTSKQVIIFENKTPPKQVIEKINYIEFSKIKNKGRYGFIEGNYSE